MPTDIFMCDTTTTQSYTLSLHDALPILGHAQPELPGAQQPAPAEPRPGHGHAGARPGRARPVAQHGGGVDGRVRPHRSEEHTSELQSQFHLVCRLLLEKKKHTQITTYLR